MEKWVYIFLVSIVIILTRFCFVKCKRTVLELNFNQPYPSSRREWILPSIACLHPSQNVKLGIFTGSRAVDGKEMYKKAWLHVQSCCLMPCQAIAYLTFSLPPRLKLPIIYDTLWSLKNRIFSGQIQLLLLLIASQTFFWLICSSFVSG